MKSNTVIRLFLWFFFLLGVEIVHAQSEIYKTGDGAIKGYDPVAYFLHNKAVKGTDQYTYTWKGAEWHFASQANKDAFIGNPDKYAPQYGGYCAYGMAQGYKASISPDAWTILGDKLYLNYDKDVQEDWNEKQQEYIRKANANWPKVKSSKD